MIPAPSYEYIGPLLNEDWVRVGIHSAAGISKNHNVVGFIFMDQNFKREPISDFIGNIDMMNEYSGKFVHFFLPGVSMYGKNEGEISKEIGKLRGVTLYHNARAFLSFKDAFERNIEGWKYSFGVEIVLMDIAEANGERHLDFNSAIFFKVDEFIQLGIIGKTSELIGKIIKLRRENNNMTARDIQLMFEETFDVNWFKSLILSMFPKRLQDLAKAKAVLGGGSAIR